MSPEIEDAGRRLADLREQHAAAVAAMRAAEAELAPLDAALATARAVYDAAGRDMAAAHARYAGPGHEPHETHRERTSAELERARQASHQAAAVFEVAERELGAALVARNTVDGRRGSHLMHARRLGDLIEQAEADIERLRRQPERPDLLAQIRARIMGGIVRP